MLAEYSREVASVVVVGALGNLQWPGVPDRVVVAFAVGQGAQASDGDFPPVFSYGIVNKLSPDQLSVGFGSAA